MLEVGPNTPSEEPLEKVKKRASICPGAML